jgi:hypothetical protein
MKITYSSDTSNAARAEKFQTSSEQRRREKSTRKRPRGTSEQMNGLTK